jgi:hypothetical protein
MPDTSVMPSAPGPMPPATTNTPRQWLRWGIPVVAFVIGVGAGSAGGESDVEASPAYVTLQSELTDSQKEANDLEAQVTEAESRIRQATDAGEARLSQLTAELDGRSAQLDQREQALVAREAEAVQAPPAATPPAPAAVVPPPPAAAVPAVPAPPVPSSTYYKNCDAARADGAAPVRVGDPGYAGHLDRDGDGVGCE